MKNTRRLFSCILLVIIFFICNIDPAFGQKKVNITAGFGIPEYLNIGVQYQLNQFQIGLYAGGIPGSNENIITFSGDLRYHFGGKSNFTDLRPWYGKMGFNYLRDETTARVEKFLYLNSRIGRDFNISKRWGLNLEAGAIFLLSKTVMRKTSSNWYIPMNWKVIPSISLGLFYKL